MVINYREFNRSSPFLPLSYTHKLIFIIMSLEKRFQPIRKIQQKGQIFSGFGWHIGFVKDNLKHILLLTMPSRKILLDELCTLNNFRLAN